MTTPFHRFNIRMLIWLGMALIIVIMLAMYGCDNVEKTPIYEPPFIVIRKFDGKQSTGCNNDSGNCCVVFQDRNGIQDYTCEPCDKYSIGDTIK